MAIARPVVANPFANTASGSPDIAVPSYLDGGFPAPAGVPVKPPRGYVNWLFNWAMQAGRHLLSRGISPWDATETQYTVGSVVYRPTGLMFMLLGTATAGTNPESDIPNWIPLNVRDRGILADYANPVAAWKNYVGQVRSAIDHWGFDDDDVVKWDEQWDDPAFSLINVAGDYSGLRWAFHTDGSGSGGGNLTSHGPQYTASDNNNFRLLGIGSVHAGGRADIQLRPSHNTGVFTDDTTVKMGWRFLLPPTASANCTFVMGFTSGFQPSSGITDGTFLIKQPTDTNWFFVSISAGVQSPAVDTGIAAAGSGILHKASITLVGGNQDDVAVPRAVATIDGATVGIITARLPYTAPGAGAGRPLSPIFGINTTATASAIDLLLGPVRYRQST